MTYVAYINAQNYDDDFIFVVNGKLIHEGNCSQKFTGTTKTLALMNLLNRIQVSHGHYGLHVDKVPKSYGHVSHVREIIENLYEKCHAILENPYYEARFDISTFADNFENGELYFGGNWDVRIVVEEEKEKTDEPQGMNEDDHTYYRECAIAAMTALIGKVPLANSENGDNADKIREDICMSADSYAAIMVNIRRGRINGTYPPVKE